MRGFALPTILISSIVMLVVLLVAVSSASTVRTTIKAQYYEQLAKVAGEAGIAYAEACLNANGGVPQWVSGPLKPNTDCTGTDLPAATTAFCTANPRDSKCSVMINGNIRSSFNIPMPPVDANGRAKTLPNTGFVDILRTSNGSVWRTYNQATAPTSAVPDLCSGSAGSIYGWNNASVNSGGASFPEPSALGIGIVAGNAQPGPIYLRKDFSVTEAGTYRLDLYGDDVADAYIDGLYVTTAAHPSYVNQTAALTVGCHSLLVRLTNTAILSNASVAKVSLKKVGNTIPLVVSDTTWRVAAGTTRHYSEVNYYADPASWTVARDQAAMTTMSGIWTATTGDSTALWLATTHSYDGSNNYPSSQYAAFRDSRDITVATPTEVKIGYACDDSCDIYIDGTIVASANTGVVATTLTLSEGTHKVGVVLGNVSGPSGFGFAMTRTSDGAILTRSDASWLATNFWSATSVNVFSYDKLYVPNPNPNKSSIANILLVGGGGSGGGGWEGGGGGAGGVLYKTAYPIVAKPYTVTVGSGGAGGSTTVFNRGGLSTFEYLTAVGGGAGAGEPSGTQVAAQNGGSGGGAAHPTQGTIGFGILGLGNNGGLGITGNPYVGGGGGGAGAVGANGISTAGGVGGAGIANPVTGSTTGQLQTGTYYIGGGGGGSMRGGTTGAGGLGGGGGNGSASLFGAANTGGGGAAGSNGAGPTGVSYAGGSGVVIISYVTGAITATGGTITTSGGNTLHTFTTSGTFTVTAIP
jgi:hypothetical protein